MAHKTVTINSFKSSVWSQRQQTTTNIWMLDGIEISVETSAFLRKEVFRGPFRSVMREADLLMNDCSQLKNIRTTERVNPGFDIIERA